MTKLPTFRDDVCDVAGALAVFVGGAVAIFLLFTVFLPGFLWTIIWTIDWLWSDAYAWLSRHTG